MRIKRVLMVTVALAITSFVGAACSTTASPAQTTGGGGSRQLIGLFRLTPGTDVSGQLAGSWFRMLEPGGTVAKGKYMRNAASPADGGLATLLTPGTAGGLRTGGYQSQPAPAFDTGGNSLADSILQPTTFFGVKFSVSTNRTDLQTKTVVPPPTIVLRNGKLAANLASWAASWNKQNFNQGAPKPVQSTAAKSPGQAQAQRAWDWVSQRWLGAVPKATITGNGATGTIDLSTGRFTLEWTSLIVGGPFNGFTGIWHLQGVYHASGQAPAGA
ncbi:MAG: hypothetical protein ABSC41_10260 [Acidimicrobiales bacterium]|jgi:hypothetical protein